MFDIRYYKPVCINLLLLADQPGINLNLIVSDILNIIMLYSPDTFKAL